MIRIENGKIESVKLGMMLYDASENIIGVIDLLTDKKDFGRLECGHRGFATFEITDHRIKWLCRPIPL